MSPEAGQSTEPVSGSFGNLSGRVALVTGGATGIGAAVVRQLAALGARVGCCCNKSRDQAEALASELNREADRVVPVRVDVTAGDQIEAAVRTVAAHFGDDVHILVNNAGDVSEPTAIEDMPEAMWHAELALNLTSAFLGAKYCIPGMKRAGHGRIINNTSLAARAGGGPGNVHYATCKGGMEAFTRGLAKELGPYNITVNAVAPGVIDTAIHQRSNTAGNLDSISALTPLGRLGTAAEAAAAIVFLATPAAAYITGETLHVNGGLRMY